MHSETKFQIIPRYVSKTNVLTFQATKVLKMDQNLYSSHFSGTALLLTLKDALAMTLLVPPESWTIQRNCKYSLLRMHTYAFIYFFILTVLPFQPQESFPILIASVLRCLQLLTCRCL